MGLNHKNRVAKWRKRAFCQRCPDGAENAATRQCCRLRKKRSSNRLFHKHTLLPLDELASMPCRQQCRISDPVRSLMQSVPLKRPRDSARLPEIAGDKVAKNTILFYPIGYFHLDIAEVRTEEGKLYLFVAIDRTSKFVFAQFHEAANVKSAVGFLQAFDRSRALHPSTLY